MIVQVKGYLTFRGLLGERSLELPEDGTLRTLLETLAVEIGEPFRLQAFATGTGLRARVAVLVNGRSYRSLPQRLETQLQDDDEVAIFPPLMGG